jgi:sulfate transport system substrate-binding protein
LFVAAYEKQSGRHLVIVQSHGGSSRQVRKVVNDEQPADVVTLGLPSDIDGLLRKRGLVAPDWPDRLPNHAVPYTSTIVFVVRHGNPHHIRDWPDLLAPGLES